MLKQTLIPLGLILAVGAAALLGNSAEARDRGYVDLRFGSPSYYTPTYYTPVVERSVAPGYYQTQYQTVLVQPEQKVRQYVPPVYETRRDVYGRPYTLLVREGYYTEVCVPARYETRPVQVYVPGCVVERPVCASAPVCAPRSSSLLNVFLKF